MKRRAYRGLYPWPVFGEAARVLFAARRFIALAHIGCCHWAMHEAERIAKAGRP